MGFPGRNNTGQAIRAQASAEFLIVTGAILIVALAAATLSVAWPEVVFSTQQTRSDQYWEDAHPFSVKFNTMKPDSMVLELRNNDPTTLTISGIWLDNVKLDFYNHTVPFAITSYPRCSAGACNMTMAPGGVQIISTANFSTSPQNPCGYGADFKYGAKYEMALIISYYGRNSSNEYNQTATQKLIGTCSGYGGCETGACCGESNQLCCSPSSCNVGSLACSGGLCVPCGNVSQPCCPPSNSCTPGYACNSSVCSLSCTSDAQSSCVCGTGNPLCNSTQYCALTIAPTSTCRNACANGSISSTCKCGSGGSYGGLYSSGYCCNGIYSDIACCSLSGWEQNCSCGGTTISGLQWCYNGNTVVSGTCTDRAYPVSPDPCKCGSTYGTGSNCCASGTYYSGNCPVPYCASNNYMGACQFCGQVEINCPANTYCEISSHACQDICSPGENGCYCTSLGYFSWWFGVSGCPG